MDISITKANALDINEIENLYNDLIDYLDAHINYPGWKKGVYPTGRDAMHFMETGALYLARDNSKIIGTIALTHEPEKAPENGKWLIEADYEDVFVIHSFAVHPDYLHFGVGSTMLQFSEQLAKEQNMKSIRLDVFENNSVAIKAYEKNGYSYIDTVDLGYGEYGLPLFKLYEKLI